MRHTHRRTVANQSNERQQQRTVGRAEDGAEVAAEAEVAAVAGVEAEAVAAAAEAAAIPTRSRAMHRHPLRASNEGPTTVPPPPHCRVPTWSRLGCTG